MLKCKKLSKTENRMFQRLPLPSIEEEGKVAYMKGKVSLTFALVPETPSVITNYSAVIIPVYEISTCIIYRVHSC